jgi:hypothetical protein|tara:strand:+ start:434 stop:616 length:183 start_codon:yes stop_codon:yes gene_type:complete
MLWPGWGWAWSVLGAESELAIATDTPALKVSHSRDRTTMGGSHERQDRFNTRAFSKNLPY